MKGMNGSITRRVITLTLAIYGLGQPLAGLAQTYYVGTCKPGKADFLYIQQAVTSVPPGSTINVCPGTYNEQVIISQPLTLQALQSGDSAGVTITTAGTLNYGEGFTFLKPASVGTVAPQVAVVNPGGPVNITGIVIDGTGIAPNIATSVASILYESASGTLNHVVLQNLAAFLGAQVTSMTGILVVDDFSVSPTVTVKNSAISIANSSFAEFGIQIPFGSDNIGLEVTNSSIDILGEGAAIADRGTGTGTVNSNTIIGSGIGAVGIDLNGSSLSITGNTISAPFGVYDSGSLGTPTVISGNSLTSGGAAITSYDPTLTIKSNQILGAAGTAPGVTATPIGIELECTLPAVLSGNTVVGFSIGLNDVPTGVSLQSSAGNFYGVPTIEQVCSN